MTGLARICILRSWLPQIIRPTASIDAVSQIVPSRATLRRPRRRFPACSSKEQIKMHPASLRLSTLVLFSRPDYRLGWGASWIIPAVDYGGKSDRSLVSRGVGNAGLAFWCMTTVQPKSREVREFMKALQLRKGELPRFEGLVFGARIALMKGTACCTGIS